MYLTYSKGSKETGFGQVTSSLGFWLWFHYLFLLQSLKL